MKVMAATGGAVLIVSLAVGLAQPAFDVVSVKPSAPGQTGGGFDIQPGGRMVAHNVALSGLIGIAYGQNGAGLRQDELSGEPAWVHTTRYDVEARIAGASATDSPSKPEVISALLRSLLEDRFKLRAHVESRMLPAYALVLARADGSPGPNLVRSALTCTTLENSTTVVPPAGSAPRCGTRIVDGSLNAGAMSIATLARMLGNALSDTAVFDETGLAGTFDVDLRWAPASTDPGVPPGPSLFTAVQDQLGLKLEPRRIPRDVLVIDRIEQLLPD